MTRTLRLHLDDNGDIYGVPLSDPLAKQLEAQGDGEDTSPVVQHAPGRVGRPPLPMPTSKKSPTSSPRLAP